MLTVRNNSKIIERILKAPNGEFVIATLLVTEVAGKFEVKMLSARPLETADVSVAPSTIACLPAPRISNESADTPVAFSEAIVSPYHDLAFFMSQPTRAPSFSY